MQKSNSQTTIRLDGDASLVIPGPHLSSLQAAIDYASHAVTYFDLNGFVFNINYPAGEVTVR